MALIPVLDASLLLTESKQHPFHIGVLQVFTPPEGAAPSFARDTYEAMRANPDVVAELRRRPVTVLNGRVSLYKWIAPDDVEIDEHLHYTVLPAPGGDEDLFELVSRHHSRILDRTRALWEIYVIDGLQGGRFAIYTKIHHALVDGATGLKLAQGWLSDIPSDDTPTVPWQPRAARLRRPATRPTPRERVARIADTVTRLRLSLALIRQGLRDKHILVPFRAPRTMFNVASGGDKYFGARSWPLSRLKAVAIENGTTVNEVVLAMIGGAIRVYLTEQNALPDESLVVMVPVNVRNEDDIDAGNVAGIALCDLGTDHDDPVLRLQTVHNNMQCGKKLMRQLPRPLAFFSALLVVLPATISELPIIGRFIPPLFNVALSNVPSKRTPLYLHGARVDANIPVTTVLHGQALNLALTTGEHTIDFGMVGCARALPGIERLLDHLEAALQDLEQPVVVSA